MLRASSQSSVNAHVLCMTYMPGRGAAAGDSITEDAEMRSSCWLQAYVVRLQSQQGDVFFSSSCWP
jgi:hypothetical protein